MCLDMSSPKTSDNIKNNKNDSKIIHLSLSTSVVRSQQLFTMPHHVWQCLAVSCPSVNVTLCLKLSFKETVLYIFIKLQTNIYTCTWRTIKQSLIFFCLDLPLYCKWWLLNYTYFQTLQFCRTYLDFYDSLFCCNSVSKRLIKYFYHTKDIFTLLDSR